MNIHLLLDDIIWLQNVFNLNISEQLKSLLTKVKEENEKAGLKFNIKMTKIMASSPISSWQRDGGKVETVKDFPFVGSKITADSDCSHKIKRHLLLGRKAMTNLDNILKSRDIILSAKRCLCFLKHCLGLLELSFQGASVF